MDEQNLQYLLNDLQLRLKKAEDVIKYYANPNNWRHLDDDNIHQNGIDLDDTEPANGDAYTGRFGGDYVGGRLARQYLRDKK